MLALSASGEVIASFTSDAGASTLAATDFADYLQQILDREFADCASLPIVMCGMIGSSIGWREVPYMECPLGPAELASDMATLMHNGRPMRVVPGLRCVNPRGEPGFLRGEETQIAGWLQKADGYAGNEATLCLPGTHTKWARIHEGRIEGFSTAVTGEMFSCLINQSILVQGPQVADQEAFTRGVHSSEQGVAMQLFSTRALVLAGELAPENSQSYLSGLLIGAEIREARRIVGEPVHVIASSTLCALYQSALRTLDIPCECHDGAELAAAGFAYLHELATQPEEAVP
ncbi:2-dehydro-3-deoxygalactonokinase [Biformimicrobium ophioploci]|uniref:2-dehydro-3-deoxygalactonokinase n=2 Tax=Biformimicrobium ophioploci TaxID=3036711 RepID=A0ABQ6LVT8_9GAMM|nr:2-dehydro-3-deoxygalactonokinase [Microbulbifer sp. NKW57]